MRSTSINGCHAGAFCGIIRAVMSRFWENIETDPAKPPKLNVGELLLGFGLLAVFVVVSAYLMA